MLCFTLLCRALLSNEKTLNRRYSDIVFLLPGVFSLSLVTHLWIEVIFENTCWFYMLCFMVNKLSLNCCMVIFGGMSTWLTMCFIAGDLIPTKYKTPDYSYYIQYEPSCCWWLLWPTKNDAKNLKKMTLTLPHWFSSEST